MDENWDMLFASEFNVFSLSLLDVLICLVIGLLCRPLIRVSGPRMLGADYHTRVVQYSFDHVGVSNIIYRIISPIVISYILVILLSAISSGIGCPWSLSVRWMPIFLYWIVQLLVVRLQSGELYPAWTVVFQAMVSLLVAVYFDWVVVCHLATSGISAFDQSNIGWQLLTGLFLVASQLILSGIVRGVNRYNSRLRAACGQHVYPDESSEGPVNLETEKRLFKFLREYSDLLPDRFSSDVLLRALFYTVMLIEDSNRPAWFRSVERFLFRFGVAKSTGIMQVKSSIAFTDRESVVASLPLIEKIWDDFLIEGAQQKDVSLCPILSFSCDWYRYRYKELRTLAVQKSGLLYGRYCGTVSIDIQETFGEVLRFFDRAERFFPPERVVVRSKLFSSYARVMPGRELCLIDGALSILPEAVPASETRVILSSASPASFEEAKRCVTAIERFGSVISISGINEMSGCAVVAIVDEERAKELSKKLEGWRTAVVDVASG